MEPYYPFFHKAIPYPGTRPQAGPTFLLPHAGEGGPQGRMREETAGLRNTISDRVGCAVSPPLRVRVKGVCKFVPHPVLLPKGEGVLGLGKREL